MYTHKIFKVGRDQAVRLPKEFWFKGREVLIDKIGDTVVLRPKKKRRRLLRVVFPKFSDDFMSDWVGPDGTIRRPKS